MYITPDATLSVGTGEGINITKISVEYQAYPTAEPSFVLFFLFLFLFFYFILYV
jgi:hypothetical protein